jgi:hypothetical protein
VLKSIHFVCVCICVVKLFSATHFIHLFHYITFYITTTFCCRNIQIKRMSIIYKSEMRHIKNEETSWGWAVQVHYLMIFYITASGPLKSNFSVLSNWWCEINLTISSSYLSIWSIRHKDLNKKANLGLMTKLCTFCNYFLSLNIKPIPKSIMQKHRLICKIPIMDTDYSLYWLNFTLTDTDYWNLTDIDTA